MIFNFSSVMDTRKLPFSEQFSSTMFSSKRKVISGFGLGIIASVFIFTIIFFNPFGISKLNSNFSSFNAPQGNSSLISWFFPVPHATMFSSSSVAEGSKSMEEESGLGKSSKNSSLLNFNGSEGVSVKTHEEGLSDKTNNVGFSEKEERIMEKNNETKLIIKDENGSFLNQSEEIIERTHKENEANFAGAEVLEKTHEEKMLKKDNSSDSEEKDGGLLGKCDIFNGRWVRDEGKPLYPTSSCPHIDRDFNCHKNGRPDHEFLKWRWQPYDCNIPRLNATDFLERLSGKRLVFVGDSLNRNMWESLVCILRHGVANKTRVYEMSGKKEFKIQGHYAFRYEDYNCSVEFVRTPFLVSELIANGGKESGETLRLDLMDQTNIAYRKADVVVFNTGHWWTHEKTSRGKDYYQEGNYVYPMLNVMEAYRKALTTWARWVDKNINANRTQVFFRGYSVTHFRGGQWNSGGQCHKETEPIFNETYLQKYPSKMKTLEDVLKQMRTPVVFMNISKLTDYRKDGHPSIYRMVYKTAKEQIAAEKSQDCSHWCLPGIPDTWNELLYASLVMDSSG